MPRAVLSGGQQSVPATALSRAKGAHHGRHNFGAAHRLAHIQSVHGNQETQRLLSRSVLQTKLMINQPGDAHEQEAERVGEMVMSMPDPIGERQPATRDSLPTAIQRRSCEDCKSETMEL